MSNQEVQKASARNWGYKKRMIIQAGDLAVELDTGTNAPGEKLQRLVSGKWKDYLVDGEQIFSPVDVEQLPPGRYRLVG